MVKPQLSFWQIINVNIGFFGIQYSFGSQQTAVSPICDIPVASRDEIPLLTLVGPVTGLIQPIIGGLSENWYPTFGWREPYFFIVALICTQIEIRL